MLDVYLAELIKSSASDRLRDLVPYGSSPDFSRFIFHKIGLLDICLESFFLVIMPYPGQPFSFFKNNSETPEFIH